MPTPEEVEFRALMERIRHGCEDALWELIDQYTPCVERHVRRNAGRTLRSKFDTKDFAQDVWASFFRHREEYLQVDGPQRLVALLIQIATSKVYDKARRHVVAQARDVRREQRLHDAGIEDDLRDSSPRPSQVAIARERWESMVSGQSSLQREILALRFRGNTFAEIAEKLQINERTARRTIDRLMADAAS